MKHFSAILVFILALMLQLWFAPAGVRGDFVLAALIVFAFLFTFWELIAFVLFGVFLLNTAFYPGLAMFFWAAIPLVVYAARRRFPFDPWFGAALGIALGIPAFYAVTAPGAAVHAIGFLLLDILACIIFGELVLCGMTA
jgi:hypothetical protein